MLGLEYNLDFLQEKDALAVQIPEILPSKNAVCLKIIPNIDL